MPVNIGKYVIAGELRNGRENSVYGWIEFAEDYGIRLELTGNLSNKSGLNFRFLVPEDERCERPEPGDFPDDVEELANRQIGVLDTFVIDDEKGTDRSTLRLSWFSQNGEVIADMPNVVVETFNDDDEREQFNEGIAEFDLDNEPFDPDLADEEDDEADDDPYGLFSENLDAHVAGSLNADSDQETEPGDDLGRRNWEDVIPGIDSETKAMYEQWDEIFDGKHDEPLADLFQTALRLPKPEQVTDSETAKPLVTSILAQLALLSVALDVCEHFDSVQTYQLLLNEILPNAKVHPNLAATEMVQHYATSDYCDKCEAEFEAELNESEESEKGDDQDDLESDPPF